MKSDGNRFYKENLLSPTRSEVYAYDSLNRLTGMERGTLTTGKDVDNSCVRFTRIAC